MAAFLAERRGAQRLDGQVAIRVDADVGRDAERQFHDGPGIERRVLQQRERGGLRERAAGSHGHQLVLGFDHVAVTGDHERVRRVGDTEQRLEPAQAAIAAPVLGELDRRSRQVAVLLQLGLEALEQRERIGRAARETRDHVAFVQAPHLARVAFHDRVAERDLAVAAHGHEAVAAHAQDRRAVRVEGSGLHAGTPGQRRNRGGAARIRRAFSAPAGALRRRCGPGAGNRGACTPAWC
jgi:hypothetical protein